MYNINISWEQISTTGDKMTPDDGLKVDLQKFSIQTKRYKSYITRITPKSMCPCNGAKSQEIQFGNG